VTTHHEADPGGIPREDFESLIASMTGPVATLAGVVVEAIASSFRMLLDQAHRAGVDAGLAQAEHHVARMVGTRATAATHGVEGTLVRCDRCGGDGLVVRTEPPSPHRRDPAATTVIPRLDHIPGETAILPRLDDRGERIDLRPGDPRPNDPTTTSKFDTRGRRD
jgi:hypothetical protein